MANGRREELSDGTNWIPLSEAATLYNRLAGIERGGIRTPLSHQKLRRMFREGEFQELGVNFLIVPGRYYIDKNDMLRYMREVAAASLARIEAEIQSAEKPPPLGG
jgi:hypothetical protein